MILSERDRYSSIKILERGHYFVYSRVHYRITNDQSLPSEGFYVGHTLTLLEKGGSKVLDRVTQRCYLDSASATQNQTFEHTSVSETLVRLEVGATLSVTLDSERYLLKDPEQKHQFGFFLVSF